MTLEEMEHLRDLNQSEPLQQCCDVVHRPIGPISDINQQPPHIFIALNSEGEAEYRVITEDGRDVPLDAWDSSSWGGE